MFGIGRRLLKPFAQQHQYRKMTATTFSDLRLEAREAIADSICAAAKSKFDKDLSKQRAMLLGLIRQDKKKAADFAIPCFPLAKPLGAKPPQIAADLEQAINSQIQESSVLKTVEVSGPYLNFFLRDGFLSRVVPDVNSGFVDQRATSDQDRVMIEYSQPNTHKAFHVGHMRNAALGDCLVRLYTHLGHQVVAANYFGDEGAHVAKCLWLLNERIQNEGLDLDSVQELKRGEFLGGVYSEAVNLLTLSALTKYPHRSVHTAKVLSVSNHPADDAPRNWHVVRLDVGSLGEQTVVCGGEGYAVGDIVPYMPVGAKIKGKDVVPKDMQGVVSSGVILAAAELGVKLPPKPKTEEEIAADKAAKGKKGKKKSKKKASAPDKRIWILPCEMPVGNELTEIGRVDGVEPASETVSQIIARRTREVGAVLHALETPGTRPELDSLWARTKHWSLDEFKRIYGWLRCRFDHDFFESECSEPSQRLVDEFLDKGVLIKDNGAIGADLNKHKLGFCLLRKSDGAGLYATKDLALAQTKFGQFNIDKSIYVVDASQSLHFQQVFKVLELMGYEQAKQCQHVAYGMVVLPHGKMSSRAGTVIMFSQLKQMLEDQIHEDYLKKLAESGEWAQDELDEAQRAISAGVIKYGMLNHDTSKDIVFEMDKWAAKTGNTGPYLMYAYARTASIVRKVEPLVSSEDLPDFALLNNAKEKQVMHLMLGFWDAVESASTKANPSSLCNYMFELAQTFSSWYAIKDMSVKEAEPTLRATRLEFIKAVNRTLKTGLQVLGITPLEKM